MHSKIVIFARIVFCTRHLSACELGKMGKQKDTYRSPAILRRVPIGLETSILTASINDAVVVETTGQKVQYYDWSEEQPFNHNWE